MIYYREAPNSHIYWYTHRYFEHQNHFYNVFFFFFFLISEYFMLYMKMRLDKMYL